MYIFNKIRAAGRKPMGIAFIMWLMVFVCSCSKDGGPDMEARETEVPTPDATPDPEPQEFDIDAITDTYPALAPAEHVFQWGPYNVHDPSIIKEGAVFYCFNTDVAYGTEIRPGIQIRQSKDLVKWNFMGWAFDGLPAQGSAFIENNGGEPFNALWAPYILKVNGEFRLYYSLSSPTPRLSVIGMATAASPIGPWTDKGLVVTSLDNASLQTNAIDPTVLVDATGNHWMYYGSAWDGIYRLSLNPATGLAAQVGDKGIRVAQRGFTGGMVNGNIEAPEVIYHPEFDKYYLFMAYDWLQTKYNVRVGRSDSPEGPFVDFHGNDLNSEMDNSPMILAPYRFKDHAGWQGVAHPSVFTDGTGQFYMAHQGRPGIDSYYMVLHVRKMYWTEDGWPIVSPQRYAGLPSAGGVSEETLAGTYEYILLEYNVVPGYAEEQTFPDFQDAMDLTLHADHTINEDERNVWSYEAPWLTLAWNDGRKDQLRVDMGRDWENSVPSTVLMTGFTSEGTAVWAKKIL